MIHFDRANLKVIETGEGFLKGIVTFAVPGVLPYVYGDSIKYEAKLPEDILSSKTIDSARGVPITDDHPKDENGNYAFVTPENYKNLVRGTLSDPHVDGGVGVGVVTLYDSDLIERVKTKEQYEVSMGFRSDVEDRPGTFNGVRYDSIQRNIAINHIAVVRDARAGDMTKIHVDRGNIKRSENMDNNNIAAGAGANTPDDKKTFSYRKFDGSTDIQVPQEIHSEFMTLRNQIKADQDQIKELNEKLAVASKEPPVDKDKELEEKIQLLTDQNEELKKNYASLEASIPEKIAAAATERVAVLDSAKASGVEIKMDGLSNREIKLQLIAKHLPFKDGIKVDSMSDDAVNARYDAAIEIAKIKANHVNSRLSGNQTKVDSVEEMKMKRLNMYEGGKK
jgi:hypothetical protein